MTERKKKIEMHVQIATKILGEIKRRSIDKLQDFEDDLMTTGKISTANRIELMNYMKHETDKPEEYMDKLRLLLIYIYCGNDISEIR
jgi:Sec1 family